MTINLDQYTNTLSVTDTAANADLNVTTKGTGGVVSNVNGGTFSIVRDSASNAIKLTAPNQNLYVQSSGGGSIVFNTSDGTLLNQMRITSTASVVNYLNVTGAATGSGPTISAQGSDTNADLNATSKGSGVVNLNTGAGTQVRIIDSGGTAVNRIHLQGQATGFLPVIASRGSDTNLGMSYSTQGTGGHDFYTAGTSFTQQLKVAHTASAVNYVQATGAATTTRPQISSQGSDSNIGLTISSKGNRSIGFATNNAQNFEIASVASTVNYPSVGGSVAGSAPYYSVVGTDTNIDLNLTPKGTGNVRFGTHTGTADTAVSGYIEIKDSGGTVRKLAVIT
jgi:hypothetical protein